MSKPKFISEDLDDALALASVLIPDSPELIAEFADFHIADIRQYVLNAEAQHAINCLLAAKAAAVAYLSIIEPLKF